MKTANEVTQYYQQHCLEVAELARIEAINAIGHELAEAVCAQADDGLDRSAYILARAIEFIKKARGE